MNDIERDNPGLPHLPPTYPVGFLVLAIILEFVVPIRFLAAPTLLSMQALSGAALLAAGLTLDIWAFRLFKAAGTNPEPFKPTTAIVAHGPYRFTRNPMYVGFLLSLYRDRPAVCTGMDTDSAARLVVRPRPGGSAARRSLSHRQVRRRL